MYVPLTLKYRPRFWADLVGQEVVVKVITNMLKSGRLIPSVILGGSRGVGKTTTARILARSLNCPNVSKETYEPCGECEVCTSITDETSFAVQEMDAASHGLVDDVRRIKEEIRYVDGSKNRVYIVDECHSLSPQAWQAFLKLLEEPPPGVVFAFCTTEVHKIPETIVSRSMHFAFNRLSAEHIVRRLTYIAGIEKIGVEDGVFLEIAKHVNGGMRDAVSMLDQLVSFASDEKITLNHVAQVVGTVNLPLLFEIFRALIATDVKQLFQHLQRAYAEVSDVNVLVSDLLMFYRDMMLTKTGVPLPDAQSDYVASLQTESQGVSLEYLLEAQNNLHYISDQIRRSSLSARAIVDVYITKLLYGGVATTKPRVTQVKAPVALSAPMIINPPQLADALEGEILQM